MISFSRNKLVAHDTFGLGFVASVDRQKVTVDFVQAGRRRVHAAWLRPASDGLVPYRPMELTDGANVALLAGMGHVPFRVESVEIQTFVGSTVASFLIEHSGNHLSILDFFLEHVDLAIRQQHLSAFTNFCRALWVPRPEDADELVGRSACIHVAAVRDTPTFARLAQ